MIPFLKWPGGKRWAACQIAGFIRPLLRERYIEPFLGGGAVFFELLPKDAVLADANASLINVYIQVRERPRSLIRGIQKIPVDAISYARVRGLKKATTLRMAEAFLYLNRTAWGGIYRVNRRGEYNVPFGGGQRTPSILWEKNLLTKAAEALTTCEIVHSDFEPILDRAGEGDVAYCDPTYTVTHGNNGFVRYNERNFSWEDQRRLASACFRAKKRGARVLVSNAAHSEIKALFPRVKVVSLERFSVVCPTPSKRRLVRELLFIL